MLMVLLLAAVRAEATPSIVPITLAGIPIRLSDPALSGDGSTVVGNVGLSSRPFLWTREAGYQDLVVLLSTLGLPMEAWSHLTVLDVSAGGRTILGEGRFRDATGRSALATFVAVVPEPSTAVLVGAGLVLMTCARS